MMIQIPKIINEKLLDDLIKGVIKANWELSTNSQNNFSRLDSDGIEAKYFSQKILKSIQSSPLFLGASLPKKVFNPIFIKHSEGQSNGVRVDEAIKQDFSNGFRIRSDLTGIIFLNNPDQYEGGELVVEDSFGCQNIKLPAGDMILFPASCLNYLKTINKGDRYTVSIAIESMVRDNHNRSILFDLDNSIRSIFKDNSGHESIGQLSIIYNNLLRLWMDS